MSDALRQAAQAALKALELIQEADTAGATPQMVVDARKLYEPTIAALLAALAQPPALLMNDREYLALFDKARHGSDRPMGTLRGIRACIAAYEAAQPPAQPDRLYDALCWALGVGDDWKPRPDGAGPFYWRKELAERAGIRWDGSRYVMDAQPPAPTAQPEPAIHWPQVVAYPGGNGGLGAWVDVSAGDGPEQVQRFVAQPVPATGAQPDVEALAHRIAWRYKKSNDPHHSDTYTFNRSTLLQFADALHAAHTGSAAE